MALNPNLLPLHINDGGRSTEQPLPLTPNVGDGNAVANGTDMEMTSSPDSWLNQYIAGLSNDEKILLATGQGDRGALWAPILAKGIQDGALTGDDVQYLISRYNLAITPEFEKQLNNLLSKEAASTEYDREIAARDTSITSTLNQLRENQMSSGLLASLGGASAGISTSAAHTDQSNISQARKMAEFNRKTSMARTMIGLLGGMASAGIYGTSMTLGRHAVAKLAADASRDVAIIKRRAGRTHIDRNGMITRDIYDY